jgi:hypothetical protein
MLCEGERCVITDNAPRLFVVVCGTEALPSAKHFACYGDDISSESSPSKKTYK